MYILSFFSEKVWLSYAHEPNVATRLFLYGLQAKKKKKVYTLVKFDENTCRKICETLYYMAYKP